MSDNYIGSTIDDAIARLFGFQRDEKGRFIWGDDDDLDLDRNRPKDVREDV